MSAAEYACRTGTTRPDRLHFPAAGLFLYTEAMGTARTHDQILESVHARKDDWVRVPLEQRVRYLDSAMTRLLKVAPDWVDEANRLRKIDPASPIAGEEWISGMMITLRQIRLLRKNLAAMARTGEPVPIPLRAGHNGRTVAQVFPAGVVDRLLYMGNKAELWTSPGSEPTRARIYREKSCGRVALVLGAGNNSSIAPLDAIHKLMVENQVVVLKMNPVNEFLAPYLRTAFADLIADGFLAIVAGDAAAGNALVRHPLVDTIHLTGSRATYAAIAGDKPVTAELGCVTPILVVPGKWSRGDLKHQSQNIAGMVTHNASFNCNAGKVLVLDQGWNQREALLQEIRSALAAAPARHPYYPGARERYARYLDKYPSAIRMGDGAATVPWTFIPGVKPDREEYALREEPFCGVLSEVSLEGNGDPDAFLKKAVPFVNDSVAGDLSCTIVAKDIKNSALQDAIRDLRYGGVAVNAWCAMLYALGNTHWGAAPGNTPEDIGSGTGSGHNVFLFDAPEKSVLYAPFRAWPKPIWFPNHRTLKALGRALARYEGTGSPLALIRTVTAATLA